MNMKKSITGFLTFSVAVAIIIVTLKVMNGVPLIARNDTLRRYTSIEEVRTSLSIREIYIPAYFPQDIAWPPSEILAQERPFPAVVMEFRDRHKGEIVLVLSQSRGGPSPAGPEVELTSAAETVPFMMKGRKAVLVVGECSGNTPCSRITWQEGSDTVIAFMKAAPFELTRISESMVR